MDDPEFLSRLQFALTIGFHYLFPPLSIGLGLFLVLFEAAWLKTKNDQFYKLTRFWAKIFGLIFVLGVASGIVMEFQFGTNWAAYSRFVGDIFGSVLASEALFAFFLESGFLAIVLFGWNRVGKKLHFFSTCMVCLGAHFSALWIIIANSWMQTPAGYRIEETGQGMKAVITNFHEVVFNPSTIDRLTHTLAGCWLAGAALVVSVGAWWLLKGEFHDEAKKNIKTGLLVGIVSCLAIFVTGDSSARGVAQYQPTKFAAMEGIAHDQARAPFHLVGVIDRNSYEFTGISVPGLLSLMTYWDADKEVKGLSSFAKDELPPVPEVFYSFHIMITIGIVMALFYGVGVFAWWRGWLFDRRWFLWAMVFMVLAPQVGNQIGWMVTEIGRQPWIVYGMLKTRDAVSSTLSSGEAWASLGMFTVIYLLLFSLFIYLMNSKIQKGLDGLIEKMNSNHNK